MYMHLSPHRMSLPPPPAARRSSARRAPREDSVGARRTPERVGIREAAGITSIVLLLFALVSPAALRVGLSAAGLLGLMGVRLSAANAGWAHRGVAWTRDKGSKASE